MEASVVIPFYNAKDTLRRAIDSVLSQEGVRLEILLIDNNSNDQSQIIAQTYADKYDSISLYKETRQGANYARNLGLGLAKNKWIQFLDADDELLPNKIFNQLSITNIEFIDVISSPITEYTYDGQIITYSVSDMGDIWCSLLKGKIGWTCSNLWRKHALLEVGGWNNNYSSHQEVELMSRLIKGDKKFYFYDVSECIVHEQQKSVSKRIDFPLTGVEFLKSLEKYFRENGILSKKLITSLHTQLYHKYLMAFKIDSRKANDALGDLSIETKTVELPILHQLCIKLFGMQNTFRLIKFFSNN